VGAKQALSVINKVKAMRKYFMSKKRESKKLPKELVKIFVDSCDLRGMGCNEATLAERLEKRSNPYYKPE
jgi:hypothetical protein